MDWAEGNDGFIPFPMEPVSPATQKDFIVREGGHRADRSQVMESVHSQEDSSIHRSGRITPLARLPTNPIILQPDNNNAKPDKLEAMKAKLMESRRLNSGSVPPPENSMSSSLTAAEPQLDRDTSVAVADIIRKANFMKNEIANGNSKLSSAGNATPPNGSNLKRSTPYEYGYNGHQAGQHTGVQVDKNITVTVHKDIGNESNELHGKSQSPSHINQGNAAGATGIAPNTHERAENFRKLEARPVSPPPQIVHHSSTDMDRAEVLMNIPSSSFLKNYFSDLNEWLEVTGYHDMAHRKRRLAMFRERQQLELQLAKMKKAEEEEDQRAAFVSGPPGFSESRPSTASMQQPSPATQRPRGFDSSDEFNVGTTLPSTAQNDFTGTTGAKRPYSAVADTFVGSPLPRKQVRAAQYNEDAVPSTQSIPSENAFRHHPQPPSGPQGLGPRTEEHSRRAGNSSLTWVRTQPEAASGRKSDPENSLDRSREQNTRMDSRDDMARPYARRNSLSTELRKHTHSTSRLSNPLSNRYFLVKSWNHDNVTQSQSDGLWATQTHNTPILAQAYSQCKSSTPPSDVVLIFSVNKSGAFQGYAIMSSLPGTAPVPKWTQKLHWTCGEPFYIEWVTTGHVLFRECGHIKNPLNKDGVDLSVVVGRDGQEIDPFAGRELLRVIDSLRQKN